jgi:hypothetical protein
MMYVYKKLNENAWVVGYYTPDGKWHCDIKYQTQKEAADRTAWLNGYNGKWFRLRTFTEEE